MFTYIIYLWYKIFLIKEATVPADSKLKQQVIFRTTLPIKISQYKHYRLKYLILSQLLYTYITESVNNEYLFSHSIILLFINIIVNCLFLSFRKYFSWCFCKYFNFNKKHASIYIVIYKHSLYKAHCFQISFIHKYFF